MRHTDDRSRYLFWNLSVSIVVWTYAHFFCVQASCPIMIELQKVGETRSIVSSLSTNDITRWIVKGNGHPIKIDITEFNMGGVQFDINKGYFCGETPLLRIVDNKYPLFPLFTDCGVLLRTMLSFSDFLNVTHTGNAAVSSSFKIEFTVVECGQDHFVCPSTTTKCIPLDKMCDGHRDCPQGEDEICTEECGMTGQANKKEKFSGKIVGGVEAAQYSWPWQVYIFNAEAGTSKTFTCGGTIVAPQWVLTAAHCCWTRTQNNIDVLWQPDQIKVHAGGHNKTENPGVSVAKVFPHPSYTSLHNLDLKATRNDFCMLKLTQPLTFTGKIQPVCLAQLPEPPLKTSCYATGWGRTVSEDPNTVTEHLMEVDVKLKSDAECSAAAREEGVLDEMFISPEAFCTLSSPRAPCYGDSGGPLVCRLPKTSHFQWQVIGMTSYGAKCGKDPAFYAKIRRGLPFFANVLYNQTYDGWAHNTTIRPYDSSVQYSDNDYVINVPDTPPEREFRVSPIITSWSWVVDDKCVIPTPPPGEGPDDVDPENSATTAKPAKPARRSTTTKAVESEDEDDPEDGDDTAAVTSSVTKARPTKNSASINHFANLAPTFLVSLIYSFAKLYN